MWKLDLFHLEDGWVPWKKGSLEEVLEDLFTFQSGTYGSSYRQARIFSPEKEG